MNNFEGCIQRVLSSTVGRSLHTIQLLEYPIPPCALLVMHCHKNRPRRYLGNKKRYHRSAGVKTTREKNSENFLEKIPTKISENQIQTKMFKQQKSETTNSNNKFKGPPTSSRGPTGPQTSSKCDQTNMI